MTALLLRTFSDINHEKKVSGYFFSVIMMAASVDLKPLGVQPCSDVKSGDSTVERFAG